MNTYRYHALLLEKLHLQNLLLEDRVGWLEQNILPRMQKNWPNILKRIPYDIQAKLDFPAPKEDGDSDSVAAQTARIFFDWILTLDPDPTKKNTQWLFNCILRKNNPMPVEDLENASIVLQKFIDAKKSNILEPDKTDLNKYQNLSELAAAVSKATGDIESVDMSEKNEAISQSDIIYNSPRYLILSPKTRLAAEVFGRNSLWCTDWGDPKGMYPKKTSHYETYKNQGPLYIIIQKNHPQQITNIYGTTRQAPDTYWQFQIESDQFMDALDRPVNLQQFWTQHPEVWSAFEQMDGDPIDIIPKGKIRGVSSAKIIVKKQNKFIAKDPGGPFGKALFELELDNDGRLEKIKTTIAPSTISDFLKYFLNKHKIPGNPETIHAICNLYYRNGVWGTIAEVGEVALKVGDYEWKYIQKIGANKEIVLVKKELVLASGHIDINPQTDNEELVLKSSYHFSAEISHMVVELMLKLEVYNFGDGSPINGLSLEHADAKKLADANPEPVSDLLLLANIDQKGQIFKDALLEWMQEEEVFPDSHKYPYWINNNLVVESFNTVRELIDGKYDSTAQWCMKIIEGEDILDVGSSRVDKKDIEKLIRNLDNGTLQKLGRWLQETYSEKEYEVPDKWDANSIIDFWSDIEDSDDEITQAAQRAIYDGEQIGTESDIYSTVRHSIENNKNILMVDNAYNPIDRWYFDSKCVLVFDIDQILEHLQTGLSDLGYNLRQEGWITSFNIENNFTIDEPSYGFSGYDESAANESFLDQLSYFI